MAIFSFVSQCFSPSVSKSDPSVPRSAEVKGSQLVPVDFEVASSPVQSGPVISEAPISQVPSVVLDSEVLCSHGSKSEIFKYSELKDATNNFDAGKIVGRGGYGTTVYHGILKDGHPVAIKQLHEDRFKTLRLHDEKLQSEKLGKLMTEVSMLTCVSHENLVHLYGCTSPHTCELLLVQEYIPNGTLSDHLLGSLLKPGALSWYTRLNIALQTASALAFLHASNILHRDVKTSNILLDNSFNAKVADFGLLHLFPIGVTHITTDPTGTPGYIDPEYYEHCHLSDKSDVYSFGVVLIELISSLPAFLEDDKNPCLSDFAIDKIRGGQLRNLVDPALGFESDNWISQTIVQWQSWHLAVCNATETRDLPCLRCGIGSRALEVKELKVLFPGIQKVSTMPTKFILFPALA